MTQKQTHTPGPWFYQSGTEWTGKMRRDVLAGRAHVAIVVDPDPGHRSLSGEPNIPVYCPDAEANARLIAAAPELLEALRDCITEDGAVAWRNAEFAGRRLEAISNIARAAIAKAEGQ